MMILLLMVLSVTIGGYGYITDARRVRQMAETYLSRLIGGRVEVEKATLSIFEGLRLQGVTVHADEQSGAPDSVLFTAQSFIIHYDPRQMLQGQLEAEQIVAEKPRVLLTRTRETGAWNYRRLGRTRNRRPRPVVTVASKPTPIPEILLRNARLEVTELADGARHELGFMAVDGRIAAGADSEHYSFELQSHGLEGVGPFVSGTVAYATGQVNAQLRNFEFGPASEFGRDVQAMLPADVREWWERHGLAGRLDIPRLSWTPPRDGRPPSFRIETDLNGVTLKVHPEEWLGPREARNLARARQAVECLRPLYAAAGFDLGLAAREPADDAPPSHRTDPTSHIKALLTGPPITLRQVAGGFTFADNRIDVREVGGRVENNAFRIDGHIDGYRPDSPLYLKIASLQSENLYIPPSPRYIASLPRQVQELYSDIKPQGTCRLEVEVERSAASARPRVRGHVDVVNGEFVFGLFPYPIRRATGRIEFGQDPDGNKEILRLVGLRGRGTPQGPNREAIVEIDGSVGPIDPDDPAEIGADVRISSKDISSEPTLDRAFPPDVQAALKLVGVTEASGYPTYHGDFVCHVHRSSGPQQRWIFDTDLAIHDASGGLAGFPYPLKNVAGEIQVRDGFLDVIGLHSDRGQSSLAVNGRISWVNAAQTKLTLAARNLAINEELLTALPAEQRRWLSSIGASGNLDVDGRITQPALPTSDAVEHTPGLDLIAYDLALKLRGGALHPSGTTLADVTAALHLTPTRLEIQELKARRGDARIGASGALIWNASKPRLSLAATAENLALDTSLYHCLPRQIQQAWDEVRPRGMIDAELNYDGPARALALSSDPQILSLDPHPESAPAILTAKLHPRDLAISLRCLPYTLEHVSGTVTVTPDRITLIDVKSRHQDATLTANGTGQITPRGLWDLKLSGKGVPFDQELRKALPSSLGGLVDAIKLRGFSDFEVKHLVYRAPPPPVVSANPPPAAPMALSDTATILLEPEIDLSAEIGFRDASLDVGIPLGEAVGGVVVDASVRDGRLASLKGHIDMKRLTMSGREVRDLQADVLRGADRDELKLTRVQARFAGGAMAGEVGIAFPDEGPSHYNLDLVLRNADVRELASDSDQEIHGALTASLSLEGSWGDAGSRRGRGDVSVQGKRMYRIPLILGLMQVTNLALPIAEPFHQASARYNLDGERVTFEKIELRSDIMRMSGSGHLDFATRQVRLSFITDNPGGLKVPFLADLWQGARNELFRINVRGTIQSPKVETSTMDTFSTTVDEVFRGDARK